MCPHGGVLPTARSAATVVILSAFSLPLLPPQMVKASQIPFACSSTSTRRVVEGLRPHSSPSVNSNVSNNEAQLFQLSISTDSLYQPVSSKCLDEHCEESDVDAFGDNSYSLTNVSYCGSTEWEADLALQSHKEQIPYNEEIIRKKKVRDNSCKEKLHISQPKEGLCIFVIGGKYFGNHECLAKGVDIWRCDITKRKF